MDYERGTALNSIRTYARIVTNPLKYESGGQAAVGGGSRRQRARDVADASGSGPFDHFPGVVECRLGELDAAEHACDFAHARFAVQG